MGPPLERLKLTVAYDGRPFSGWQSQPNENGIQDHLKRAFSQIVSAPVKLHGAGRTDSGVHALGQVAHVDVPRQKMSLATLDLGRECPSAPEIRVIRCQLASAEFHAQYSAVGKVYRYRIWNAPIFHPMEIGRSWHVPQRSRFRYPASGLAIDLRVHMILPLLQQIAGRPPETTTRTIHQIRIRQQKELVALEFDGNGFLYRMVRMLTGTIVRIASRRADYSWITELLSHPGKTKTNCTAPAGGLYLVRVKYL